MDSVLWINIIANNLEIQVFSWHRVKAKKHSHMGAFFCDLSRQAINFLHKLHMINMDNFNHFNYKIIEINNYFSLKDKHYRQLP